MEYYCIDIAFVKGLVSSAKYLYSVKSCKVPLNFFEEIFDGGRDVLWIYIAL